MDSLERRQDYDLDVALVDLDDEQERAQCIFFNNEYAQRTYDLPRLERALDGISFENAGFELIDLQVLLPKFEKPLTAPAAAQLADVQTVTDEIQSAKVAARAAAPKLSRAELKAKRKDIREKAALRHPETVDVEFFTVLVFKTSAARLAFLASVGSVGTPISGKTVLDRLDKHGQSESNEAPKDSTAALRDAAGAAR